MKLTKRLFILLISLLILPVQIFAYSPAANRNDTVYFTDGSYSTIQIEIIETRTLSTLSARKIHTHYNPLGNELWSVALNTTFSYDGQTSTCDVANITIHISGSGWYTVSRSASRDGNTGSCSVVMGYKLFGITTDKKTVEMSISCDKNGNIS